MKYRYVILTTIISVVLAVLPFVYLKIIHKTPTSVPIEITDDSLYYYARAVDIYHGHPFIGNPYVLEHINAVSANFFVADWVWSLPLFLGFSLNATIIINQIIWFVIFSLLLYWLFYLFSLSPKMRVIGVTFCVLLSYWYIARPVAMQVVFPFFLGFLVAVLYFIKNPKSWRNRIILGVYSGCALYTYTYLAEIMALVLILIFAFSFTKKLSDLRSVFFSGLISSVLAIPFLLYTWSQVHTTFYTETVVRLGLLYTRSVGGAGLFYFVVCVSLFLYFYFNQELFEPSEFYFLEIVTSVLGVAVVSNVFTGIDFELAVHVGRFIDLWVLFVTLVILSRSDVTAIQKKKVVLLLLLLPIVLVFHLASYELNIWKSIHNDLYNNESYEPVLTWLNENTPKDSVVLADNSLSLYIPILSHDYVLFNTYVGFHIMSDKELEDRYLASRVFTELSVDQIENDYREFAGVGNAVHQANLTNRTTKECLFVHKLVESIDCKPLVTFEDLKGKSYFENLKSSFDLLSKKPIDTIKNYKVSYIVIDTHNDKWVIPKALPLIWSNQRFEVFSVK